MLKLPVCPYCNAVNRYDKVRKTTHEKIIKCSHCGKEYEVSYISGRIILMTCVCIALIIINLFFMFTSRTVNLVLMTVGTATVILISFLLFPFTVRYKKIAKKNVNNKKTKNKR